MTPSHLSHVRAPPDVKIFLIIKTELQKRNLNNENWLKAFNEPVCRMPPTAVNTQKCAQKLSGCGWLGIMIVWRVQEK